MGGPPHGWSQALRGSRVGSVGTRLAPAHASSGKAPGMPALSATLNRRLAAAGAPVRISAD
jgi:hypothetical protein